MGSQGGSSADSLVASLEGISASSFSSEVERIRARDALFDALRRVQSPWDIAWEQVWVSGAVNASIKTLIDLGVFTKWAQEADGAPITNTRLAELTGADVLVIRRMMNCIAGQQLVTEVAEDTYARTPWARNLADDKSFPSLYGRFYHELNNPMFRTLPAYLKETNYQTPRDDKDCNWQFCHGKGTHLFQYMSSHPEFTSHFNDAMECHSRYNLTPWPEVYPTETVVEAARAAGKLDGPGARPLVVDVGGSKGHDLRKFLALHRDDVPAGSLVLQDLPEVTKGVEAELASSTGGAVRVQAHDFFTPQPVEGARVYFMHNVLHDWPDDKAREILAHLARAMEPGYSRLLIHESLVSARRPLARVTVSDITMMACLAAAERSEEQWRELVGSAGLRLVKIWRPVHSVESVIEVELA